MVYECGFFIVGALRRFTLLLHPANPQLSRYHKIWQNVSFDLIIECCRNYFPVD